MTSAAPVTHWRVRASLALLVALALLAVLVPWLAPADPRAIGDVLATRLVPPFGRDAAGQWHALGTDRFGRDLFARMMLAGRISLLIGVGGSVLASAIGTIIGLAAGWRGGILDRIAMAVSDALLSIPRLILLLLCGGTGGLLYVLLWALVPLDEGSPGAAMSRN